MPDTEFWNKEFVITSVTRADLQKHGFPNEQIAQLSDEDMETIAVAMEDIYCDPATGKIWNSVPSELWNAKKKMLFWTGMRSGQEMKMDSLDWTRKYEVLSISRLDLSSSGLTTEQVNQLSDEDLEQIAEELSNRYLLDDFEDDVLFVARLILAEKEQLHGCEEPMRETSDA